MFAFIGPKIDISSIKSDKDFASVVEDYVLRVRNFYDSRARWHRRFYRLSTILIILIGAGLPLAASLSYPHKAVLLGTFGVTVAALTALRAFYHWDQFWVLLRTTEVLITKTYLTWKASAPEIIEGDASSPEQRKKSAAELAELILAIRGNEAQAFFRALVDRHDMPELPTL
jgi:hypothetical protein